MANPTSRWDFVPVWGVYLNPVTNAASGGKVSFALASRITRVDGRVIYPDGASVVVQIGLQAEQDGEIRSIVRAAWRAADEATAGVAWDAVAWDTWWDTIIVPAAVFTRFPAADDPDIVQTDWSVTVREQLTSAGGKQYAIQPLLAHLDLPIPGINLGLIEVPPGAPGVPAPMYAKAVPGGVASLDSAGKVPLEQLPDDIGGGGGSVSPEEVAAAVASLPIICVWTGTDWATLAGGPVPTSSALVRDYRSVGHDTEDVTAPTYYSTLDTWLQQPAGA